MNLSPTLVARRTDRLFALAIIGNLLLLGLLAGQAGVPVAAVGSAAAFVLLFTGWLLWAKGATPTAAWGLALLLAGTALTGAILLPGQASLLANLLLVGSLLPAYRRWPLVLLCGLAFAAVPWLAGVHDAQPAQGLVLSALLLAQTGLLALVAVRDDAQAREAFDIDFLVRAMGREGVIRLDMAVLKAETPLGQRLKQAQERVAGVLQQLRHSAQSATEAAASLQVSGQELTERSQHAGAELGAAAMTLTQIAVIVKDSATAAMAARETAQVATRMAEDGGQIVGRMVEQMRDIDASARRITDIIRTIEAIAFQTNMLALNAAVEAARAGEQGRGFAVVAGEVRALAQRAATASGEVKQLVNDALQSVAQGNALAAEAGQTITALTHTVARVDQTFHSLADDTNEHAAGIEAIRDTMNELNAATQHNLRLAEQSRGIADELAERAVALTDSLAGFRLGAVEKRGAVAPFGGPPKPRMDAPVVARAATPAPARAAAAAAPAAKQDDNVEFF